MAGRVVELVGEARLRKIIMNNIYIQLKIDIEELMDMVILNEKQRKAVYHHLEEILQKHLLK